jgi:polyhydroxyalkanoate synthesis regulator phasin
MLMERLDKSEAAANARIEKVEAEAALARKLHLKCMDENAALREDIGQLREAVKALQERA